MGHFDGIFSLAKKIADAISKGEESHELENSYQFSETTKRKIIQDLSKEARESGIGQLKAIDTKKDWKKVVSQLHTKKKSSIKKVYKIAAIIFLSFSVGYITYYNLTENNGLNQTITKIDAGTDKAILTLENGNEVALEKDKPFENESARSDGQLLKYAKANSTDNSAAKQTFNYLTIPRGGQYQIQLSDGTLVWLNADSKLKYPVAFKENEMRTVELIYGEAYFDVSSSSNHNGRGFKVLSKGQAVEVLGTQFNIKAYCDERFMYTTLVEGKVSIEVNGRLEQLNPSEQVALNLETERLSKSIVEIKYHTAWVNGYFNFKDTSLKEIMRVLSRWYDVKITFDSKSVEEVTFSGLLNKKQNLEDILKGIQNTKFINAYEINNDTITIQ